MYLRNLESVNLSEVELYTKKWFLISLLTTRYSGSSESVIDEDIKRIEELGIREVIDRIEAADLSDTFWSVSLPEQLETSSTNNTHFRLFIASQVYKKAKGFLSSSITVQSLAKNIGDLHHLFPKKHLQDMGMTRRHYNQVANLVFTQQEINVQIGADSPSEYMARIKAQIENQSPSLGGIIDENELYTNLKENCVPAEFYENSALEYNSFLKARRELMADYLKQYYFSI